MSALIEARCRALTMTTDGATQPVDYNLHVINDFVYSPDTSFEDLQAVCLGMAAALERLRRGEFICKKCGIRKDSEAPEGQTDPPF